MTLYTVQLIIHKEIQYICRIYVHAGSKGEFPKSAFKRKFRLRIRSLNSCSEREVLGIYRNISPCSGWGLSPHDADKTVRVGTDGRYNQPAETTVVYVLNVFRYYVRSLVER